MSCDMREKVEATIEVIRPALQADGGDVELVSVENGIVKVRLQGACAGCPMSHSSVDVHGGAVDVDRHKLPRCAV